MGIADRVSGNATKVRDGGKDANEKVVRIEDEERRRRREGEREVGGDAHLLLARLIAK